MAVVSLEENEPDAEEKTTKHKQERLSNKRIRMGVHLARIILVRITNIFKIASMSIHPLLLVPNDNFFRLCFSTVSTRLIL